MQRLQKTTVPQRQSVTMSPPVCLCVCVCECISPSTLHLNSDPQQQEKTALPEMSKLSEKKRLIKSEKGSVTNNEMQYSESFFTILTTNPLYHL